MSEGKLDQITKIVESSKSNGVRDYHTNEDGEIMINLLNGKTLNSFLPAGHQILAAEYDFPKNDHQDIFVDPSKLSNTHYLAIVAHELGHILNLDNQTKIEYHIYLNISDLIKESFLKKPLKNKLKILGQIYAGGMKEETEAWNSGKIVSDALGIDEQTYEEIMVDGITGYYSAGLYDLQNKILKTCPEITDETRFKLYNPFTQSSEIIDYASFKTLASNSIETNEKALQNASRKLEIHN